VAVLWLDDWCIAFVVRSIYNGVEHSLNNVDLFLLFTQSHITSIMVNLRLFFGLVFFVAFGQLVLLGVKFSRQRHNFLFYDDEMLFENAGNSTLGFHHVEYINLKNMFDRDDAIAMQSEIAGLDIERFVAVSTDDINENGKGLPPSSSEDRVLRANEKACLRSHAQLWAKMIRNKWPSMLILEADAAWDVNIRDISKRSAKGYNVLRQLFHPDSDQKPSRDDPFNIQTWDMLSFGTCQDDPRFREEHTIFHDPHAPLDQTWYELPLNDQRVIRRSGYVVCTTAYALSLRGARKLLLRAATDLDEPLDLMIGNMALDDDIKVYAVYPPPIVQWQYTAGIGAENLGSSVQEQQKPKSPNYKDIWKNIRQTKNIWQHSSYYHPYFRNGALQAYKKLAYPPDSDDQTKLEQEQHAKSTAARNEGK
jgi:GR25 family glycosyltransferase involved in LPS biosynthesis